MAISFHTFPGSRARTVKTREKVRADSLYKTAKWKKLRRDILDSEPLCRICKSSGIITAATVVDHIIPHRGKVERFWDEDGLQPLCKPCHDRKTAGETVAPGQVPRDLPEAEARVVLVCGAPGSGRSTYARARARPGDVVLDIEQEAAIAEGVPRYMTSRQYRSQAYGRAVSAIRRHAVDGKGTLYACVELPQAVARKEWLLYLGERCEVVVLPCNLDEVPAEAEGLAISWLSRYTANAITDNEREAERETNRTPGG